MAKDGTMRGGARPNTGPKKKALADKIIEGKASVEDGAVVLPEPVEIEGSRYIEIIWILWYN